MLEEDLDGNHVPLARCAVEGVTELKSPWQRSAPAARRSSMMEMWLRMVAAWRGVPPKRLPGALRSVKDMERRCWTAEVIPKDEA